MAEAAAAAASDEQQVQATCNEELKVGDRARVQGGKNYEKFHGGMEGTVVLNDVENKTMTVQFDDVNTSGPEPLKVSYRNMEPAPTKGGYRHGAGNANQSSSSQPSSATPAEPKGPLLDEHGDYRTRMLVELHSLQGAAELNGICGRLRKWDVNASRWEVDVRGHGIKRLKEDNLNTKPAKPVIPSGLTVEELKQRGNDAFKKQTLEEAVAFYSACLELCGGAQGDSDSDEEPKAVAADAPPEAQDNKYKSVVFGNRAQCYINLCRETNGEEKVISKEARMFAMKANMDSARAVTLDATNGKAYYRRGCAMLGMAPSASRSKEAIYFLELALEGRASGNAEKNGMVLPNAMRNEVKNLLDYAKRRFDACTETHMPDVEQCKENCKQQ